MSRKGTVLSSETKERMAEVRRRWWASKRKARKLALKRGILLEATAVTAATSRKRRGRKEKGVEFDDDDALASDDDDDDDDSDDDDDDDEDFSLDPSSSLDLERAVAELWARPGAGEASRAWRVLNLELWARCFLDAAPGA